MNFLGHLYLAGRDPEIRLGNFIADHIKGVPLEYYPSGVVLGIRMHRAIDYFTDSHVGLSRCRALLRPAYGKYAGVALDVAIDHFLSAHWSLFSRCALGPFVHRFYLQMLWRWRWLPPFWRRMIFTLIRDDRLCRYRHLDGLYESFDIMSRTTSFPDGRVAAASIIESHYDGMLEDVCRFMVDIVVEMRGMFGTEPCGVALAGVESGLSAGEVMSGNFYCAD